MLGKAFSLRSLLCGLAAVLAVLASYPVLDSGFCDDWSYARTCLDLLRTGHLIYNGWATAMLGWQAYWGALIIKLFGFSFLTLRFSTLPFAAGCAIMLFSICRRLGLNDRNAILCALTVVLSPVFVPLAASFMTDVPGLFWLLLCLYGCVRALAVSSAGSSIVWLALASAVSVLGGTGRQTTWLGALVMVPSVAWLLRHRKGIWQSALALWLSSFLVILLCTMWYRRQPYSVPETLAGFHLGPAMILTLGHNMTMLVFTTILFCLPVLVGYLPLLRTVPKTQLAALLCGLAVLIYLGLGRGLNVFAPWMMGVVTPTVVDGDLDGLGSNPTVLTMPVRIIVTVFLAIVFYAFLHFVADRARSGRARTVLTHCTDTHDIGWRSLLWLLGPFALAYLALLVPRAGSKGVLGVTIFDRYAIPLLPVVLILALRLYQGSVQPAAPGFAFLTLAVFSVFAVAYTHDYFAGERARLSAASALMAAGVPRTAIQASAEFGGWTELQLSGRINDPRILIPKNAYHPTSGGMTGACWFWFADHTPSVDPKYFVVASPMSCLAPSTFPPVSYRAWLPPFQRQMSVQTRRSQVAYR